jgi:hypothetical protein
MTLVVGKSKGNKQVNKNAAKEKSKDSSKNKRIAKIRNNLGGGQSSDCILVQSIDAHFQCNELEKLNFTSTKIKDDLKGTSKDVCQQAYRS